jgi:hypothetical protein
MSEHSTEHLASSLKEMSEHCQVMLSVLKADRDLFVENDMSALEANNKRKMELIDRLNLLVKGITDRYPQGILQDASLSGDVHELVKGLAPQVSECYDSIAINKNIVYSNMTHLKNVWDKILALKSEMNSVYDRMGQRVK